MEEREPHRTSAAALPSEAEIANHVVKIQRRRLGYAFGGPDPKWCDVSLHEGVSGKGIELPVNPDDPDGKRRTFTGCLKYATCELIPDDLRWTRWEHLSQTQQDAFRNVRCYRATRGRWEPDRKDIITSEASGWDVEALQSRKERGDGGEWIGNPFGVRSGKLGEIAKESRADADFGLHRDFAPCPVGGCVVPEMQRDYSRHRQVGNDGSDFWKDAEACPFYFRHTNIELTTASPNPQRFTQCYVTLPHVRKHLEELGVIVVAPVFRTFAGNEASYSYTFYSGLSFIQLPTRAPLPGVSGWTDETLPLRWQATAATRREITERSNRLPIERLFEDAEQGMVLAPWERKARVISVSEGQSTAILLQWVILRRFMSAIQEAATATIDLHRKTRWRFDDYGIVKKLKEWGYKTRGIVDIDEDGFVSSTLHQDLVTLGVLDAGARPTDRLKSCVAWLLTRYEENSQIGADSGFRNLIQTWLPQRETLPVQLALGGEDQAEQVWKICWLFLLAALKWTSEPSVVEVPLAPSRESLRTVKIKDVEKANGNVISFASADFPHICRLVPPMHTIVRANWNAPLRWIFMPLAEGDFNKEGAPSPRLFDGLIVIVEDDVNLASLPYRVSTNLEEDESSDPVLLRLRLALPLLTAVSDIEEGYVRESFDFYVRNQKVAVKIDTHPVFKGVIATSDKMREILKLCEQAAPTRSTVLVTGENGTGKGRIARAIHHMSPRAAKPFVAVNCGAIPTELIESELFGHEKGAFTGAHARKSGLFETANGGTIFLDEIGVTSPAMQAKLLTVLEDREVRRVGGTDPIPVDVRVIAATNSNLQEMVEDGSFREDLFYRLSVIPIELPPLRERTEDISALANHFVEELSAEMRLRASISAASMTLLEKHSWRGNVRELRNVVERAMVMAGGGDVAEIEPEHLPPDIRRLESAESTPAAPGKHAPPPTGGSIEAFEALIKDRAKQDGPSSRLFSHLLGESTGVEEDERFIWMTLLAVVREVCTNRKNVFALKIGAVLSYMSGSGELEQELFTEMARRAGVQTPFPDATCFKGKMPADFEARNSSWKKPVRLKLADLIRRKVQEGER